MGNVSSMRGNGIPHRDIWDRGSKEGVSRDVFLFLPPHTHNHNHNGLGWNMRNETMVL